MSESAVEVNVAPSETPTVSNALQKAQQDFDLLLQSITKEHDLVNFIRYIEQILHSDYGVSIFDELRDESIANTNKDEDANNNSKHKSPSKANKLANESRTTNTPTRSSKTGNNKNQKLPKLKRKKLSEKKALLKSSDSVLVHINLRDVVNMKSFNSLTPVERDRLLEYLPPMDKTSPDSISSMFSSSSFISHLNQYQSLLEGGEFESKNDDYLQYLKGKQRREHLDPWKEKHYEEYWGEKIKQQKAAMNQEERLPTFSYVELSKKKKEEVGVNGGTVGDVAPEEGVVDEALLQEFYAMEDEAEEISAKSTVATASTSTSTATNGGEQKRKRKKKEESDESDDDDDSYNGPGASATPKRKRRPREPKTTTTEDHASETGAKSPKIKRERSSAGNSFRHCAFTILKREGKPLSATTIVKMGIKEGMISTTGKTPQNTLASVIYCEMKKDPNCIFTKVGPMTFGLRDWSGEMPTSSDLILKDEPDLDVGSDPIEGEDESEQEKKTKDKQKKEESNRESRN